MNASKYFETTPPFFPYSFLAKYTRATKRVQPVFQWFSVENKRREAPRHRNSPRDINWRVAVDSLCPIPDEFPYHGSVTKRIIYRGLPTAHASPPHLLSLYNFSKNNSIFARRGTIESWWFLEISATAIGRAAEKSVSGSPLYIIPILRPSRCARRFQPRRLAIIRTAAP